MSTSFDIFCSALARHASIDGVLGEEEMVFPIEPNYGYDHCRPRNALVFGSMGVDGVHYAVLTKDGRVLEDSPVLHISPMDSDCLHVLAPTFLDFLSLGSGVSTKEMRDILDSEVAGAPVLVDFLRQRFRMDRILRTDEDFHRHDHLLSWAEPPLLDAQKLSVDGTGRVRNEDEMAWIAESDAKITDCVCPHCGKPCPSYRRTCKHCRKTIAW